MSHLDHRSLSDREYPATRGLSPDHLRDAIGGMTELAELHVRPDERSGAWLVAPDRASDALSSHRSAHEAERAARRIAAAHGAPRIFLHDRYRRVRTLTPQR